MTGGFGRARVVVVEDDPICAAATARVLGRAFDIITIDAQNERAALRAVNAQRDVDGLVVDVRLGRDHEAGLAVVDADCQPPYAALAAAGLACHLALVLGT